MQGKVSLCLSTILPSLVDIGVIKAEIKSQMFLMGPRDGNTIITY